MSRKRSPENEGLPKRWSFRRNSYYYQVPPGQERKWDGKKLFKLGKTLPEAYKIWASRLESIDNSKSIDDLFDRYELEILPTKSNSTQYLYRLYIKTLRPVFGHMDKGDIEPFEIYKYLNERSKKKLIDGKERGGIAIAKREIRMFSDLFDCAIKWGEIKKHPFKGQVKYETEKPRDRYITNKELALFLSLKPKKSGRDSTKVINAYTNLKLISGLRQQDLLNLRVTDLKDDDPENDIVGGIHVTPLKTKNSTGKKIIIEWTPDLREAVKECLDVRPVDISPYVICTRRGESYYDHKSAHPGSGWRSIWRRQMKRALKETELDEPFTEHDLRAKTASDMKDVREAQQLLAHANIRTTQRIYRRKPEIVRPAS